MASGHPKVYNAEENENSNDQRLYRLVDYLEGIGEFCEPRVVFTVCGVEHRERVQREGGG
jgi:hypothetical protein